MKDLWWGLLLAILALAIIAGVAAGMGMLLSWVLAAFGVHVSWLVCSAMIWLAGVIFGFRGRS